MVPTGVTKNFVVKSQDGGAAPLNTAVKRYVSPAVMQLKVRRSQGKAFSTQEGTSAEGTPVGTNVAS